MRRLLIRIRQSLGSTKIARTALSPASVNPKMQRVSGAVLGTIFRSVSFSTDPAFAKEPEPLHPLIRTRSPGWGGLCHIRVIRRRARLYVSGGEAPAD